MSSVSSAPEAPEGSAPHSTGHALPFGLVLGVAAGIAIFSTALTTFRDIDLYWHILAGRELLNGVSPDAIGQDWSFAPDAGQWTTTQWLSEVLLAWLADTFGWAGPATFRVLTTAAAIGALAHSTLRGRAKGVAGFPFLITATVIALVSQERPAQFTLIGAAVLGGVLISGHVGQGLPRWWVLLPATTLWAQLHGGWVLVPFVLGLLWFAALLDRGLRDPLAWRSLGLAGLAAVAGCLSPAGLSGLTAPLRFSQATQLIQEWDKVQPMASLGLFSVALLSLLVLGWTASRHLPGSETATALILFGFSWLAWRNLAPGMALLTPLVAHRLVAAFPQVGARPEPGWSRKVGISLATLLTLAGVLVVANKPNLPSDTEPIELARAIAELPAGQQVLNHYNVSGIVLYFGGADTMVAIDGRADRYGSEYISDYVDLLNLTGDWEQLLDELDPTSALIKTDSPLTHVLVTEYGWTQVGEAENGYVLLAAPVEG